jgi:iron(III) transport system permease protein
MTVFRSSMMVLLLAFFGVFLFLPLYIVVAEGLRPALVAEVITNPVYLQGLLNSGAIAVVVTALVAVISLPLAVIADRFEFPGKGWVNGLILLPMVLPPFVGALGFNQIFGQLGALNALLATLGLCEAGEGPDWLGQHRFWVVCLIEALHLYPIFYLNVSTALANIDPSLDEAARNLGASQWQRFRRVTLPLVRPGLFAGGIIVFIWSFAELGTPLMLGYTQVTAVQIFNGITEVESNPLPYTLVVVLLVVTSGLYMLSNLMFGVHDQSMVSKGGMGRRGTRLAGWRRLLPGLAFGGVTFAAVLPHLGVLLLAVSRDWYNTVLPSAYTADHFQAALSHANVVPSIIKSLHYSLLATLLAVGAGMLVALLVVRWRPPGWRLIDIFAMLPLAVPGIILAFGYLSMATRYDWLRSWLDPRANPTLLLIIAYGVRRLPYVVRACVAGLQQTPVELEHAAANLGANGATVLRRIVVPLIAANVIAGSLFAFSFSMLEVSDSLILAHKAQYFPITRALYELAGILGAGPAIGCAFGVWAMVFLGATIFAGTRLLGSKMGALFRL